MRKIQAYHSTPVHLSLSRKHLRRLKLVQGTEDLVKNIEAEYQALNEKVQNIERKREEAAEANDDIDYFDTIMDNEVINLSMETKMFDMKSNSAPIYQKIFPDSGYSPITNVNKIEEISLVEALVKRIESLGPDHILSPYSERLTGHIKESRKAVEHHQTLTDSIKAAESELEIAKTNIRDKYFDNYLKACSTFGQSKAETFFSSHP